MQVFVAGVSYRTVGLPALEAVSVRTGWLRRRLAELITSGLAAEGAVLATCNRVEVYAAVERFHEGSSAVNRLLTSAAPDHHAAVADGVYAFYDRRAVEHALAVTAGLDSLVLGEEQILGQMRDAFRLAQAERTLGPVLSALFRGAIHAGRRVRRETPIGAQHASIVSTGLALAAEALGGLAGRRAVLVGTGQVARLAGESLRAAGAAEILVVGRTPARRDGLAAALSATPVELGALAAVVADADLLVASTTSRAPTVRVVDLPPADRRSRARLVLLDLGVPRDVEPEAAGLAGVTLIDLETLRRGAERPDAEPPAWLEPAWAIVRDEATAFLTAQLENRLAPTIRELREHGELLRQQELARVSERLAGLTDDERAAVVSVTRGLVNKLLHEPVVRGKALAAGPEGDVYAAILRELFGLESATGGG